MGKYLTKTKVILMILVVVAANAGSLIHPAQTHAFPTGGLLSPRAIRMGDSTPGAVTTNYLVSFKPVSAYTVKGIIVDFCSDSPVVGSSTCTLPPGFSVSTSTIQSTPNTTPGLPASESLTDLTGAWTAANPIANRTLKLTNSTGVALSAANTYAFNITAVHNPTATGSFYARIITYTLDTGDIASYAAGTEGSTNAKDYGSVALSTNNNISISARVPEQLQFCVSGGVAAIPNGCGTVTNPTLTLGHPAGAGAIVDASATDTANAYLQVSTNAGSGANIRMRNLNTCTTGAGGLFRTGAGTTCDIPAVGGGSTTPTTMPFGTAAFGLNISAKDASYAAPAVYGTASNYGMDATTSNSNVSTTYGSPILTTAAPVANANATLTFAATASATTPAGLYQATIVLICTGTF